MEERDLLQNQVSGLLFKVQQLSNLLEQKEREQLSQQQKAAIPPVPNQSLNPIKCQLVPNSQPESQLGLVNSCHFYSHTVNYTPLDTHLSTQGCSTSAFTPTGLISKHEFSYFLALKLTLDFCADSHVSQVSSYKQFD